MNRKIYLHEIVKINRDNRANYFEHMTVGWAPAMKERSPAPVRTATRSTLSLASFLNASASCFLPASPSALRFSMLSTVTYATRPPGRSSARTRTRLDRLSVTNHQSRVISHESSVTRHQSPFFRVFHGCA